MKKILFTLGVIFTSLHSHAQTLVFHENFETADSVTASGNPTWASNLTLQVSGLRSYRNPIAASDTSWLTTSTFSTTGNSFVILNFSHICKIEFFDAAIIEASNDNGVTWNRLTGTQYLGTAPFQAQGNKFASASYIDWVPGNNSAVPTNTWWKQEAFDVSVFLSNAAQCKLRFKLYDVNTNGANNNYGWVIDDINVIAAASELNPPVITYINPIYLNTIFSLGPFNITADITDQSGLATADLFYTVNNGPQQQVAMTNSSGNTWVGVIPASNDSDTICYYVAAVDASPASNSAVNPLSGCRQFVSLAALSFPYFDNFDGPNVLWTDTVLGDPNSQWQLGTPNFNQTNSAHSAPNAWDINLTSVYTDNAHAELISPVFDFSTTVNARMSFWHNRDAEGNFDGMHIEYTTDGNTWNILGIINDPNATNWYTTTLFADNNPGWDGNSGGWIKSEYTLSLLNNVVGPVQFKFVFVSDPSVSFGFSGYSIDDFEIRPPFPLDAEAELILSPDVTSCVGTGPQTVSLVIYNDGSQPLVGPFNVAYVYDNGAPVVEQYIGTLAAGVRDTLVFATPFNNTVGMHTLEVYTDYTGDNWHLNDTLSATFNTLGSVAVPYFNGFETFSSLNDFCLTLTAQGRISFSALAANAGSQGIQFDATNSSDWDFGSDTITSSQFYIWSPTMSDQQRANARLIVNTTGFNHLVLQFDAKLLYSFGNEYTNFRVKVNGQMITPHLMPNNSDSPYLQYSYLLDAFLPANSLTIDFESKVAFDAQFNNSGIYFDNLYIYVPDSIDAGVQQIVDPRAQTQANATETVTVRIKNYGFSTLTSIPVSYQVNNNVPVTETWTGSLAGNQAVNFTFATTFTAPTGAYSLCAWTSVLNDTATANDSTCKTIIGMPILPVPFATDFEGPLLFAPESSSPVSWELGMPLPPNINTTHSGSNAWEIDLNGPYSTNSNEYLYTPFFDFSQTTNAELRFWQWYHADNFSDGGRVELSLDGGQTWSTLGVAFDPLGTNWYNQNFISSSNQAAWTGTGGAYFQSKYKLDALDNFPTPVQFRFVFTSDNFASGNDGWAIDDFEIFVPVSAGTNEITFGNTSPLPIPGNNNVKIFIENSGLLPIGQVNATLEIDNVMVVTDALTFNPMLQPGQAQQHQFSLPWTNASPGFHTVRCWTSAPNGLPDTFIPDDTTAWTVSVMDTVAGYPYCNDFEDNNGTSPLTTMNAVRFTNTANSFRQGTPQKNIITSAHGGTKCWITNLTLNYLSSDSSGLFLPIFTVDTTNCYHIEFWTNYQTPVNQDGGVVQYSYDMGYTWQTMGIAYEPNWYVSASCAGLGSGYQPSFSGTSGTWVKMQHDYRFSQAGPVIIRFRFGSDVGIQSEGWAIDDICFNRIPPCVLSIDDPIYADGFMLDQNMPNPASQTTTINYSIPEDGKVVLRLTNILGEEMMSNSETQQQGQHAWNIDVSSLAAGVYFYELNFGNVRLVKRLIVSH